MAGLTRSMDTLLTTRDASRPKFDAVRGTGEMKYVFVCGMPRSGTTILAKEIAKLANCTGFENTGVMMDEGQYLQDVYPTEWACGGAGRFGFEPQAHLTEESPLLTSTNVARLRQSWEPYWDSEKTIRVEKTPGNLLKTRFLQVAFPNACFVVVKRHPVAVSLATQKWSRTPLHELFEHWLRCHRIFDEDKKRLERLYELSYEDYIGNPEKCLKEIANFIGSEFPGSMEEQAADGYNQRYLDRWARMLQSSPFRSYYRSVAREYEPRFAPHGYSLLPLSSRSVFALGSKHVPRPAAILLRIGAAVHSVFWRCDLWLRVRAHRIVDHHLPPKVRALFFARRAMMAQCPKGPDPGVSQRKESRRSGPIFVIGCPRSGTTLLHDIIKSSGGFACLAFESDTFTILMPKFPSLGSQRARKRLLEFWLKSDTGVKSGLSRGEIEERVEAECRNVGDFLRIVMEALCRKQGVHRWAEKTPGHALHIPLIKRLFPDSLIVHIIRDGRDVALSLANFPWMAPYSLQLTSKWLSRGVYWGWIVRKARSAGRAVGRDYYELRYEDLVQRPQETLASLGKFIGHVLDYDEIVRVGAGSVTRPFTSFRDELSSGAFSPIARWKKQYSQQELARFEALVGDCLGEAGYELYTDDRERRRTLSLDAISFLSVAQLELKRRLRFHTPLGRTVGWRPRPWSRLRGSARMVSNQLKARRP